MLFSEIYGSYFNVIATVLSEAADGTLTANRLTTVVQEKAFAESTLSIPTALTSQEWPLLDDSFQSMLQHICIELFHLSYFRMYAACPQGIRTRLLVSSQSTGMPEDASYSGKSLFPSVIMTISEGVLSAICSRT